MYDWLSDSLDNAGTVVTANRRLARELGEAFAATQLAAGKQSWRTPDVHSWHDWLVSLANGTPDQEKLPARLNEHQSQVLWERCLQKEIGKSVPALTTLVRQCREARQRLADWQVSIREVARAAQGEDQKLFASVAGRYLGLLEREEWVDDAGLANLILELIAERRIRLAARVTFAGFERRRPVIVAVSKAMIAAGTCVGFAPVDDSGKQCSLAVFDDVAAEFRAAGAWARHQVEGNPGARVAIIADGLDKDADGIGRLVRDGATPGWQHGHSSLFQAVNVSYGQRLSDYPAIAVALLLLRWLVRDLPSREVALLLRTPLLGTEVTTGRSQFELRLRRLPNRNWSPSMLTAELRGWGKSSGREEISEWLVLLAEFSKRRRELPKSASPSVWVVLVDEILRSFMWPGRPPLNSADFQLINRWRELLNEFARLGLVSASIGPVATMSRLESMAGDTVFQPEAVDARIQLMGPLEASGLQFDALWVTGVTTANWPSAATSSVLLSRRLQEKHGMPDATPADTLAYARQMLTRLVASGETVVCSHALNVEDAEQTVSDLLTPFYSRTEAAVADPGWYAAGLADRSGLKLAKDLVPVVLPGEEITGGAETLQRQLRDPVAAFIHGRMGARNISPQAVGIPAPLRGSLIHDALYSLYIDLPSSETIRSWQGEDLGNRLDAAVNFAFARHERNTDGVLQQLFQLERRRIWELLRQFVIVDGSRGDFAVAGVEGVFEFVAGPVHLPLRFDRIDSLGDKGIAILDYKTGSKKQLLNRSNEAQEIQLFVYACATDAPVSALALVNVDTREISFAGAGQGYTDADEWPEVLQQVKDEIAVACAEMAGGDVRINIEQGFKAARPLNVLSRYSELRHDAG